MAKFVKGSYRTISEVHAVLEDLRKEGYAESDITLVTNKDNTYKELDDSTDAQIKLEEHYAEHFSLWEKILNMFPIFTSDDYVTNTENPDSEAEEDTLLDGYQKQLDDGEIIVIVDDLLNKESALNLEPMNPDQGVAKDILEDAPEKDSHPDVEAMEDVLEQETTYVPGDEDKI